MDGNSNNNYIVANNTTMHPRYFADSLTGNNCICLNNFFDLLGTKPAITLRMFGVIMDAATTGGSYAQVDANNDGIIDIPCVIDKNNVDNYQLTRPVDIANEPIPPL